MTPSNPSIEELLEIARAATPGPWMKEVSVYSNGSWDAHFAVRSVDKQPDHPWSPRFITFMTGTLRSDLRINDIKGAKYCRECETWHLGWTREIGVDVRVDPKAEADATFIATFNPVQVIALLERVKALEEALEPFADEFGDDIPRADDFRIFGNLTLGHFRKARALTTKATDHG